MPPLNSSAVSPEAIPIIRERVNSDLPKLKEVYFQTRLRAFKWLETGAINLEDFDADTEGERIWVAELNEEVVGFISVWEPENFIHHLYVLPECSGRNIGSQLLHTCLSNIGVPARLKCVSANTRALQFYSARGWQTIAVDVGPDGEYHLMQVDET